MVRLLLTSTNALSCLLIVWSLMATPVSAQQAESLTQEQAEHVAAKLWAEESASVKAQLQEEVDKDEIKFGEKTMRLLVKQFGQAPSSGAALYISMHGGGNAAASINDQQWQNQIKLYEPGEGYYVAPRAPTDTWNMWHEAHMDDLIDRLILAYVVCKNVDPNRVYLMGYSAGGDGVFQLAPRMSDRFAAVSMMAGHPNETKADGLRNVPFALFMGGDDAAYNRNKLAEQWREELARLAKEDVGGYEHFVQIYPKTGHWMKLKDREVLPWFKKFTRQAWPKKVVWLQDDRTHSRLYWLGVDRSLAKERTKIVAEVVGQEIRVVSEVSSIKLYLNDQLMDLNMPVKVKINDQQVFEGIVPRTQAAIETSLAERMDRVLIATAVLELGK